MSLPLKSLSAWALILGECLGYLSLFLTPDVPKGFLLVVPAFVLLSFAPFLRMNDRSLLLFVASAVLSGIAFGFWSEIALTNSLSRSLLLMHGLLWLARSRGAYRYWRLGLAFLEIIVAAILSPETHMFFILFLFAMVSSLALVFGFLERRFIAGATVPMRFVVAVSGLTFAVFLSSLLIFPLLPRSNWGGAGRQWAEAGYTETVDFQSTLGWASGSSRPLVWVFLPEGGRWESIAPGGLLRGDVLDRFTGADWRPGAKQSQESPVPAGGSKVEIFREAVGMGVLPVPYGTQAVLLNGHPRRKLQTGEFPAPGQRNRRVQYAALIGETKLPDLPKQLHRERPDPSRFPGITALAAELARGGGGDLGRVQRVQAHFRGFRWSLAPTEGVVPGRPHPVEKFLLDTKEGHCELFATAAALLFRGMGMPARLVAGFRAQPSGAVLTARNTDAHAWVEVWVEGSGWMVVDPSPIVLRSAGWGVADAYELVNAYWHRYILSYEFDWRAWMRGWKERSLAWFGLPVVALLFLWAAGRVRRGWPGALRPRAKTGRVWERLERRLGPAREEFFREDEGKILLGQYHALRFGRAEPGAGDILRLEQRAAEASRRFFSARTRE